MTRKVRGVDAACCDDHDHNVVDPRRQFIVDARRAADDALLSNKRARDDIVDDIRAQLADVRRSGTAIAALLDVVRNALFGELTTSSSSSSSSSTSTSSTSITPSNVMELVCYGVGSIAHSSKARTQVAVALYLRESLDERIVVDARSPTPLRLYDPLLSRAESALLHDAFDVDVLDANDEARRRVALPTLFFMPHCPRGLYHNALRANASQLERVALLGNAFSNYALMRQSSTVR